MHLCLSCNQPCDISSIFCDACRLSLLERSAEEQQEQVMEGSGEGMVDLVALPDREAQESTPLRMTEGGRLHFWRGSGAQTVETLEEEAADATVVASSGQATNLLVVPAPARRQMPRHVRRALLVFCIVGAFALTVDGILLTDRKSVV